MPSIQHADIGNAHMHEPKGVSTATENQVYVSDGAGSGSWETLAQFTIFSAFPIGTVIPFAGSVAPVGWSLCHGQLVGRVNYSSLFSVVGSIYGAGDGATTFQLPDCRGRVSAGKDNMGGSTAGRITNAESGIVGTTLGTAGGSESVVLSANNVPVMTGTAVSGGAHTHTVSNGTGTYKTATGTTTLFANGATIGSATLATVANSNHTHTYTVNSGSANSAHANVQPTIIMPMIIYHGVA